MLNVILNFLEKIGIRYEFHQLPHDTIMPGVSLKNGAVVIDKAQLLYVGDVLHEAGHLACMPLAIRNTMNDKLAATDINMGGEMMALAWSFAAAKHLKNSPTVVFHENGYRGEASHLIATFERGIGVGIPLLQWNQMCLSNEQAAQQNKSPYPHMISWTCNVNNYQ